MNNKLLVYTSQDGAEKSRQKTARKADGGAGTTQQHKQAATVSYNSNLKIKISNYFH